MFAEISASNSSSNSVFEHSDTRTFTPGRISGPGPTTPVVRAFVRSSLRHLRVKKMNPISGHNFGADYREAGGRCQDAQTFWPTPADLATGPVRDLGADGPNVV